MCVLLEKYVRFKVCVDVYECLMSGSNIEREKERWDEEKHGIQVKENKLTA